MFYIPKIGCCEGFGRTDSRDPMPETSVEWCGWLWPLWSIEVKLEHPDELPGEAKPSESIPNSEGAGVQGGVSGISGIGWSLKQADS